MSLIPPIVSRRSRRLSVAGGMSKKHWTVPRTDRTIAQVLALFPGEPTEVDPSLDALEALRQEKRVRETYSAMLDQLCTALRVRHYARRTEQAYGHWIRRFTQFHHGRQPAEMAEPEINRFLTHLAVTEKVSASTQNQALAAVLFLYRHVIGRDLGDLGEVIRARKPERLPVVMTREEVKAVLANLTGAKWLMASIMYGAGLRLMECLRLRVQDLDFARSEILIRDGKGAKDRMTMLPESLKAPLQEHLTQVKAVHQQKFKGVLYGQKIRTPHIMRIHLITVMRIKGRCMNHGARFRACSIKGWAYDAKRGRE